MTPNPETLAQYELTFDADAQRYTAISPNGAKRLLGDTLSQITAGIAHFGPPTYYMSDDGTDYLNAARDQMNRVTDLLIADTDDETTQGVLDTLNCDADEVDNPDNDLDYTHAGFLYGYCDHNTTISDLARMNDD